MMPPPNPRDLTVWLIHSLKIRSIKSRPGIAHVYCKCKLRAISMATALNDFAAAIRHELT